MLVSKSCFPWTALCQLWKVPVIQIQEYSRETLDSSDGWFWLQSSRMALWKLPYTTQQRGHVCPAFLPSRLPRVTLHREPVALPALLASSTCFLFFFFLLYNIVVVFACFLIGISLIRILACLHMLSVCFSENLD